MKRTTQFTAVIEREGNLFVSLCPQLDIASQGSSVEEAKSNLQEAIELFFETTSQSEIDARFKAYEDS
jgi:predicted RNase H-like HicB family nuclease